MVIDLDLRIPFTAARARNAGFSRLLEMDASTFAMCSSSTATANWLGYGFPTHLLSFEGRPDVAAVCGRLRERYPERSIYNWLCDKEWERPAGEVRACAGNVMMRVDALVAVGGYRENVIAAEEDELCVRLRAASWRIWRLENEMALHDAAMTHFDQWWRRSMRAGYAFAQGADLHGAPPERHFVWESRRAWMWGVIIPFALLLAPLAIGPFGLIGWLIYPIQIVRLTLRASGPIIDRASLAYFQVLARFPEGMGQIKFLRDRLLRRRAQLIEHK